jgi:hypothetical protein
MPQSKGQLMTAAFFALEQSQHSSRFATGPGEAESHLAVRPSLAPA